MNNTPDSLAAHMALVDAYANDPTWRTKERAKEQRAAVEASARALIARADALERQAVPTREFLMEVVCLTDRPDLQIQASAMLASSPPAPAQPEPQEGPLLDGEGWTITHANGHSGPGWYAHCEDYPEEGAVFVAAAPLAPAQPDPLEALTREQERLGLYDDQFQHEPAKFRLEIDEGAIYLDDVRICAIDDERDNSDWRFKIEAMNTLVEGHHIGHKGSMQAAPSAPAQSEVAEPVADERDSYDSIWNALQEIDSAAVMLPTFEVRYEGGIEAFTKNIVEAIHAARAALASQPTAQGEPLTEDQIITLRQATQDYSRNWSDSIAFARAIEAAHHIGRKA